MARVTVEDCLKNVDNRFDLILKSSKRAHQLAMGSVEAKIDWENDKPTVVALREIAENKLTESDYEAPVVSERPVRFSEDQVFMDRDFGRD